MIVKLTEQTIDTICEGLLSGSVDKVTVEPRNKTKKGITFFVHYEMYDNDVIERVNSRHSEAVNILREFWEKYLENKVVDFSFKKNGPDNIVYSNAYKADPPALIAKEIAVELRDFLRNNTELGNIMVKDVPKTLLACIDSIINSLGNGK